MATASSEPLSDGQAGDKDAEERLNGELRQLPDQVLQGRLQRMQQSVDSGDTARLPDGGEKCRLMLSAVRRELARRQVAPSPQPPPPRPHGRQGEPDDETRERTVQSMCAESSDIQVTSSLLAQVETPACPSKQLPDVHVMEQWQSQRWARPRAAPGRLKRTVPLHYAGAQTSCPGPGPCVPGSSLRPCMEPKLESCQVETPACPSKQLPDVHVIEPKLEPCEDSPVLAPDATEDCEPTPLSGDHPFFTAVMSRSHVQTPFQMGIPVRFQHRLPKACAAATLLYGGKSWAVSYRGDLKFKKLDASSWMGFAVDNQLQVNDACVFELVTGNRGGEEELVFQMQILRGGLPEELTSKGATADEPIVIMD